MKVINKNQQLIIAASLARFAHHNQKDKANQPYVNHLIRVAGRCNSIDAKIVAWLHDIVEDGYISHEALKDMGFLNKEHLVAIELLDRGQSEYEETYYSRIKDNRIAKEVKLADLFDNMDMSRFYDAGVEIIEKHWGNHQKYKRAYSDLLS